MNRRLLPPCLATAFFIAGPLLVHAEIVNPLVGLEITVFSAVFGLISALFGLRLVAKGAHRDGALGIVVGLLPIAFIGNGLIAARTVPRLNDVSTDLDNPPQLQAAKAAPDNAGQDLAYPVAFRDQVRSGYPDLISKPLALAPPEAFARAQGIAKAMPGWKIEHVDAEALTIEGSQVSRLFRFVDDFAIRVEPADGGSVVAMRSRSRMGKGDFGVNAERIRAYFAALDKSP